MKKNLMALALVSSGASATSSDLLQLAQNKQVTLTKKEARVARIGYISSGRQMSGGILGTYPWALGWDMRFRVAGKTTVSFYLHPAWRTGADGGVRRMCRQTV